MLRLDTLQVPTSTKYIQERLSDKTLELKLGSIFLTCTGLHHKLMSSSSVNLVSTQCKLVALNKLKILTLTLTIQFLFAGLLTYQDPRLFKLRY